MSLKLLVSDAEKSERRSQSVANVDARAARSSRDENERKKPRGKGRNGREADRVPLSSLSFSLLNPPFFLELATNVGIRTALCLREGRHSTGKVVLSSPARAKKRRGGGGEGRDGNEKITKR